MLDNVFELVVRYESTRVSSGATQWTDRIFMQVLCDDLSLERVAALRNGHRLFHDF